MNCIVNLKNLSTFDRSSFKKFLQAKERTTQTRYVPAITGELATKVRRFSQFACQEYGISIHLQDISQYGSSDFGNFIREKRSLCGISLRKFAKDLAVSPPYLSDVENANQGAPITNLGLMKLLFQRLSIAQEEMEKLALMAISSHILVERINVLHAPLHNGKEMKNYIEHFQLSSEELGTFCLMAIASQGDYPFLYQKDRVVNLLEVTHYSPYDFGEFVRQKRQQQYISLRQFAIKLGITAAYLSDIENGAAKAPTTNAELAGNMMRLLFVDEEEVIPFYLMAMASQKWDFSFLNQLEDVPLTSQK